MDLSNMTTQLHEGAIAIERCMEKIEEGKRAETLLPELINKQATLALSIKYWADLEIGKGMDFEEFIDNVREVMKHAGVKNNKEEIQ